MSFLYKDSNQAKPNILQKALFAVLVLTTALVPLFVLRITQSPLSTPRLYLLYILVLVAGLLWVLDIVLQKKLLVRKSIIDVPFLLLIGVFILSGIFSVVGSISFMGKMNIFVLHTSSIVAFMVWAWLLIQTIWTSRRWNVLVQAVLGSSAILAIIFVLSVLELFSVRSIIPGAYNFLSTSNMLFGVYMSIVGTLAFGMLLIKRQSAASYVLPAIMAILSVVVLAMIGFKTPLIIFAVGIGLLIVIGSSFLADVFSGLLVIQFALFIAIVLSVIFGLPQGIQVQLPVEVTLGGQTSYHITGRNLLSGVKEFFIGSGPGTFLQAFSEHRTASFNTNPVVWSLRFERPYNSLYALVTETGVLGALAYVTLLLTVLGAIFGSWMKTRPGVFKEDRTEKELQHVIRLQVFVVAAAFIAATVALCFSYFDVAAWFVWWTLLALVIVGLASLVPTIITEERISLQVSPQYSLLMSFGMVVISTGIILIATFGGRMFLADVAYAKALTSNTLDETRERLDTALSYRPNHPPYMISRARVSLERARREARSDNPNTEQIANFLATAVNTARNATDRYPNDIESWDTLATMYINTQALVPGANEWAIQSLNRAIALEPTNPVLHWQLGNAQVFAGNIAGAEESYKKAIRLKPNYIIAYVSLAELLEASERYDQAIALYQPIFPVIVENAEALFNLGRLFYNRGAENDYERAAQVLQQSITISPDYANARFTLGLVYEALGMGEEAIEQYERVSALNPDNTDLKEMIARVQRGEFITPPTN